MQDGKLTAEERLDIQELFANYCWALNTGDAEGYIAQFAKGGWVDHKPQGRCEGREAMLELLNQIWYGLPYHYLGRQHQCHNFVIKRDGNGARARVCWTINRLDQTMNRFELYMQGHWDALCVMEEGRWKFRELTVVHWYRETAPWVGKEDQTRMARRGKWG